MKKIKEIYIITLFLIVIGVTTTFATGGTVNTNGVRMRKGPSTETEIITDLHNGYKVEIIEKDGEWYKIKYNNEEGYIRSDLVNSEGEIESNNTNEPEAEENVSEEPIQEESHEPEEEVFPKTAITVVKTKVYIIPSLSSSLLTEIEEGKTITINNKINKWSYISYEGQKGWARNYVLETALEISEERTTENVEEPSNTPQEEVPNETIEVIKKYINVDAANIRQDPNTSSSVVGVLSRNAKITVIGKDGDWYKIEHGDIKGYILGSLVSDKESISSTSRSNEEPRREEVAPITEPEPETETVSNETSYVETDIVSFAKKYLGYKYVLGGTTPSGFDCSGFVYYVFNSCGYSLGRACSAQLSSGTSVSKANLKPGDLVFFNNGSGGSIGHVGIYIGGGNFIHAANSKRGVVIDTINSGYYNTYYYSAKRLI